MRVLITAPFSDSCIQQLREVGLKVDYKSWLTTGKLHLSDALLPTILEGQYDIVIVEGDEIKEEIIEKTDLKLIGSVRGSPNNISLASATAKRVPVIAAPGRNIIAVAELTIALMLAQARKVVAAERLLKSDFFIDDFSDFAKMYSDLVGIELHGRTVGIIGLGQIGFEVGKRLQTFGMMILVHDPYVDLKKLHEIDAQLVELDELLTQSDIITIHCKATEETRGLLGASEIQKMKKNAILINTARASIVDEYALVEALKKRTISGAGLDVFSMEPVDSDNEFLELDNVTVMPHMGGNTLETIERQSQMVVEDILAFVKKKPLKNILNPEVLD